MIKEGMNKKIITVVISLGIVGVVVTGAVWYRQSHADTIAPMHVVQDGSTIVIQEDGLSPDTLTVKAGTTVKFTNADKYWHWPASDPHPSHTFYPEIDPHEPVKPGATWQVTLSKVGKWGIHDHLAPYITGTIIVTE